MSWEGYYERMLGGMYREGVEHDARAQNRACGWRTAAARANKTRWGELVVLPDEDKARVRQALKIVGAHGYDQLAITSYKTIQRVLRGEAISKSIAERILNAAKMVEESNQIKGV